MPLKIFFCCSLGGGGGSRYFQESPRQTKPKKGPKRKVHELRPFLCEFWCFSLGKTTAIHIELLFRSAPVKSSSLFGLVCRGPLLIFLSSQMETLRTFRFGVLEGGCLGRGGVVPFCRERKNQPEVFVEVFWHPLGSWTSARSAHGCPHPNACFSKVLRGLPEVFDPGHPHK